MVLRSVGGVQTSANMSAIISAIRTAGGSISLVEVNPISGLASFYSLLSIHLWVRSDVRLLGSINAKVLPRIMGLPKVLAHRELISEKSRIQTQARSPTQTPTRELNIVEPLPSRATLNI